MAANRSLFLFPVRAGDSGIAQPQCPTTTCRELAARHREMDGSREFSWLIARAKLAIVVVSYHISGSFFLAGRGAQSTVGPKAWQQCNSLSFVLLTPT